MKEEAVSVLVGLGMMAVIILATAIFKKFFNMTTSGALIFVIIGIGVLSVVALLVIEYVSYRARKKQN